MSVSRFCNRTCMHCNCFWGNYLGMAAQRCSYHNYTLSAVYLSMSVSAIYHKTPSTEVAHHRSIRPQCVSYLSWQPRRRPSFPTGASDWQQCQTVLLLSFWGPVPPTPFVIEELCRRASYKAPAPRLHWAHLHLPDWTGYTSKCVLPAPLPCVQDPRVTQFTTASDPIATLVKYWH